MEGSGENSELRKRSTTSPGKNSGSAENSEVSSFQNVHQLMLHEEIFLIGLKNNEGYCSFWNDQISSGLRGCLLIELAIMNRIALEPVTFGRKLIQNRHLIVISDQSTDDSLLDEVLRRIKERRDTVSNWLKYLNGESWNPSKMHLQIRNTRERIAKNLVEKGILTTTKQHFFLFDMTVHPLVDSVVKNELICRIQSIILTKWRSNVSELPIKDLALVFLAQASDVLEKALESLTDHQYLTARERLANVVLGDPPLPAYEVLWAVISEFNCGVC